MTVKSFDELQSILEAAIELWGNDAQIDIWHEEIGELLTALNQYKRGRVGIEAVQEEIADVVLTTLQLSLVFGEEKVGDFFDKKLDRLAQRVQN